MVTLLGSLESCCTTWLEHILDKYSFTAVVILLELSYKQHLLRGNKLIFFSFLGFLLFHSNSWKF